ncbi:uncharacterized protein LOC122072961 [Macadamia integrifolia]|uniref:uncharacterized protein LOC122072961 n=1 Tax=Macadamia integrifolia TaxID=60698 RepID=UPI001C501F74|nr:uncharacterized protein LOC122072961 [Macadamia integrifolia]
MKVPSKLAMTCNTIEFEVAEILLRLPQLIDQDRDVRDSHIPLSRCGKRKRSAIVLPPSNHPSSSTRPLVPHSCNSRSRKKMTKQDLLEFIQQSTQNIRTLKKDTPKTTNRYEILKHTNWMLNQMKIETLNSIRKPITGPALEELPSQAPPEGEKDEEEVSVVGVGVGVGVDVSVSVWVVEQSKVEVGRFTSGSETSVSCITSKETNELKRPVNVPDLPDLNVLTPSCFSMNYLNKLKGDLQGNHGR